MGKLIDDLLTFSRLGRQQIMETGIDMGSLARGVFEELAALTPERKIKFTASSAPWARGDKAMIQQVLANLLSNAIKFTKNRAEAVIEFGYRSQNFPPPPVRTAGGNRAGNGENGTHDAALEPPHPNPLLKGEGRCQGNALMKREGAYYVKDNGEGFDMKYYNKLFGVFQRLHSAAEFEGTGVGLALVHRIITRHGGRVWAEGCVDQGRGVLFHLTIGGPAFLPGKGANQ